MFQFQAQKPIKLIILQYAKFSFKQQYRATLKVIEMFLSEVNILDYYLQTYNYDDDYIYNIKEKELDFSMFESSNSNVPILYTNNNLVSVLLDICHPSNLFR